MAAAGVPGNRILRLWAPLEAAWLLMAVEGPYLAAILARLSAPTLNLAAFGVAWGFAMLFESPVILIMSATTALVENRHSLRKLQAFSYAMNGIVTLGLATFVLPPVFRAVTGTLMGLPPDVVRLAHPACALLLPWPAAIGYRRFNQGLLVRAGLTRRVAYGTALRLATMSVTAALLALCTSWPGACVGTGALAAGVTLEAIASRYWAREARRTMLATPETPEYRARPLDFAAIAQFYLPLAATSIMALALNPAVSFLLGRSRMALESLAVMPVVNSLSFLFVTAGLTFQEVTITLYTQEPDRLPELRRFALRLALLSSGGLALLAATPLADLWLFRVAGLAPDLARFARLPVAVTALLPGLTALICFHRSLLVSLRTTRPITASTAVEVGGTAAALFALTQAAGWIGAVAAVTAMVAGRVAALGYLLPRTRRALRDRAATAGASD